MTSGPVTGSGRWISSTSRPRRTNAVSRSSTVVPAGTSTYSASQPMGTLTARLPQRPRRRPLTSDRNRSLLHSKSHGEPDVALDDVAHVADAGAELQGAFDAHAEREAGILLGIDAGGDEHPRVDHPAATPLDPARTVAVLGEPDVELGRRLGEREVGRPPAGDRVGAEQRPGQVVEGAAQVRHGQP